MDQALSQLQALGSACSARSKQQGKQQSKQLLHALVNVSNKQWDAFFQGSASTDGAAVRILAALQPQLQLPHPYDSVTATCMAFQLLERLLHYFGTTRGHEQQCQLAAQQKAKQQPAAATDGPDEQQSRDTNTPAPCEDSSLGTEQLQVLCHLHACAGLCWQAIVSKPTDLGLARHFLQSHASAQSCLVLIHQYCTAAGIGQELQQLLVSLLLHGTVMQLCPAQAAGKGGAAAASAEAASAAAAPDLVLVKQEPCSQAAAESPPAGSTQSVQHKQQLWMLKSSTAKQPAVPLLSSLKALMRSSKAYNAAARAAQRASNINSNNSGSSTPRGAASTPRGAAGARAGSPAGPLHAAVSAAELARAEELSVSGVKAWGLIASEMGPKLLDKAVGQPMLDVSGGCGCLLLLPGPPACMRCIAAVV
jgi:hypothetical protein